jgi:rubrerythrin
MDKTAKNLKEAFAGESQANRKYLAYADKADLEGYSFVAKLFRATAEAETLHAMNHFKNMCGVKSTEENLRDAMEGENFEHQSMYPRMIKEAQEESQETAKRGFTLAMEAEKVHEERYKEALGTLCDNKDRNVYLCNVCGYIHFDEKPAVCPICGAKALAFKMVE